MLGWAEIVAATGQFLWPGTGISTVRLWAVFHGRQQPFNLALSDLRTPLSSGAR